MKNAEEEEQLKKTPIKAAMVYLKRILKRKPMKMFLIMKKRFSVYFL